MRSDTQTWTVTLYSRTTRRPSSVHPAAHCPRRVKERPSSPALFQFSGFKRYFLVLKMNSNINTTTARVQDHILELRHQQKRLNDSDHDEQHQDCHRKSQSNSFITGSSMAWREDTEHYRRYMRIGIISTITQEHHLTYSSEDRDHLEKTQENLQPSGNDFADDSHAPGARFFIDSRVPASVDHHYQPVAIRFHQVCIHTEKMQHCIVKTISFAVIPSTNTYDIRLSALFAPTPRSGQRCVFTKDDEDRTSGSSEV
ncbi:hypothetical protein G7046_g9886 [Stylonectria norvegica]|nr:hypothetical protein G7046_g9886 [Stylonectria norvegica]